MMVKKGSGFGDKRSRLLQSYELGNNCRGTYREMDAKADGMRENATHKHIQNVLAGADEISERFGSHPLQNGMTVAQNMAALAQMIAELTLSASDNQDQDKQKESEPRRGAASEGEQ